MVRLGHDVSKVWWRGNIVIEIGLCGGLLKISLHFKAHHKMIKVVILIGGPVKGEHCSLLSMFCVRVRPRSKLIISLTTFVNTSHRMHFVFSAGTRFRPLSLELPKPLFPVAGFPLIHHHIEACRKVSFVKILCSSLI